MCQPLEKYERPTHYLDVEHLWWDGNLYGSLPSWLLTSYCWYGSEQWEVSIVCSFIFISHKYYTELSIHSRWYQGSLMHLARALAVDTILGASSKPHYLGAHWTCTASCTHIPHWIIPQACPWLPLPTRPSCDICWRTWPWRPGRLQAHILKVNCTHIHCPLFLDIPLPAGHS